MFKIDFSNHPRTTELFAELRGRVLSKDKSWVQTALKVIQLSVMLAAAFIYEKVVPLSFRKVQPTDPLMGVVDDPRAMADIKQNLNVLNDQIENDLTKIENAVEILGEVNQIIEGEKIFNDAVDVDKPLLAKAAVSTYASSYTHYGPVVLDWMHATLERAVATDSQLVFMARDGLAPYKVAKMLKQKYPEKYGSVNISVAYLSRAVVAWSDKDNNLETVQKYMKQQGVVEGKQAIFVDVGYEGSMIEGVKKIMKGICNINFFYLLSFNMEESAGYVVQTPYKTPKGMESGFSSIPHKCAGQNPATYWLEDTHVGALNSSDRLVECDDGKIRPGAKVGIAAKSSANATPVKNENGVKKYVKSTCKESDPKSYLYKRVGFKAVTDYARTHLDVKTPYLEGADAQKDRMMSKANRLAFDAFMYQFYIGNPYLTDKDGGRLNSKKAERYSLAKHF